jgi:uncharacterized membrane protein
VQQLRQEVSSGLMTSAQMQEAAGAQEDLTTLRESNAHLRAHNKELLAEAQQARQEAAAARQQLQPLQDRIT